MTEDLPAKLAEFLAWAFNEGNDFDIEEKAVSLGLAVAVPYDPAVHSEEVDGVEPGDEIYVLTDEVKALLPKG